MSRHDLGPEPVWEGGELPGLDGLPPFATMLEDSAATHAVECLVNRIDSDQMRRTIRQATPAQRAWIRDRAEWLLRVRVYRDMAAAFPMPGSNTGRFGTRPNLDHREDQ
jgi:hypothetical protein